MSLDIKNKLYPIAKERARELRKNQTEAEKVFWEIVRDHRTGPKIYRQYPIFYSDNGSESFFIADFYCFSKKTVIEIDGDIHKKQLVYDEMRTDLLNSLGISVIKFTNGEVMNDKSSVLKRLNEILI